MLKICRHLGHEICNNFSVQHTALKCKETEIKILTHTLHLDVLAERHRLQPSTKFLDLVRPIRVYLQMSGT